MDRFIVEEIVKAADVLGDLKSSMDRFIVDIETTSFYYDKFKIQYG